VLKLPRKTLINFTVILSAVLFLSYSLIHLKNPVQKTFKPQLSLVSLLKREIGGLIFYHRNMVENERLRGAAEALRSRLFDSREIFLENNRLKSMLGFKQRSPLRLVPARIIARSPDSWSSSATIDKGKNNGIKRGMVLISPQGLVGRVAEASDNTSKILLVNDPSLGVSAIVQRSRQEGLVNGTLGSNLIMRYLPKDADIAVGDLVVTSGLSQIYPKGLLVGKVINVGSDLSALSRYAVLRPAVNCSAIAEALVIIP